MTPASCTPCSRTGKFDEDPDLLASLFPMYAKVNHTIALFTASPKVNNPSLMLDRIENPLLAKLFTVYHKA